MEIAIAATSSSQTRTEALGIFHDADTFQAAIDDLLISGFDRAELSLLAGKKAVNEKLVHMYQKIEELEDDQTVPRAAYIATETRGEAEGGLVGGLLLSVRTASSDCEELAREILTNHSAHDVHLHALEPQS